MKYYLSAVAIATLFFTGCSQKSIEVENSNVNPDGTNNSTLTEKTTVTSNPIDGTIHEVGLGNDSNLLSDSERLSKGIQSVYFDFDRFDINSDMQSQIEVNSNIFKSAENRSYTIKVEGNCDEWGTDEYNYALGLKRAKSAQDNLILNGISKSRTVLVSYGESNPSCSESTRDCWAKNRRVDFKLLP